VLRDPFVCYHHRHITDDSAHARRTRAGTAELCSSPLPLCVGRRPDQGCVRIASVVWCQVHRTARARCGVGRIDIARDWTGETGPSCRGTHRMAGPDETRHRTGRGHRTVCVGFSRGSEKYTVRVTKGKGESGHRTPHAVRSTTGTRNSQVRSLNTTIITSARRRIVKRDPTLASLHHTLHLLHSEATEMLGNMQH
jgi:hypothetical protein